MYDAECAFCEARGIEDWRFVAETEHNYVFPTYGMLDLEGYMIITPKDHTPSYGAWGSAEGRAEYHDLIDRARDAISEQYGTQALVFEHGMTGQTIKHAHTHVVPGLRFNDVMNELVATLPSDTSYMLMDEVTREERDELRQLGHQQGGYLYVESEDAAAVFLLKPADEHKQILRKVAARVMGNEDLADWKKVQADPVLKARDLALIRSTTADMRPYFEDINQRTFEDE